MSKNTFAGPARDTATRSPNRRLGALGILLIVACVAWSNVMADEVTIRWFGGVAQTDIAFEGQFTFPIGDPAATAVIDLLTVGADTSVTVSDGVSSQTWNFIVPPPPFDRLDFRYCPGGEAQCGIPPDGSFAAPLLPTWEGVPFETDCGAGPLEVPCSLFQVQIRGEDPPIGIVFTDVGLANAGFGFEVVSITEGPYVLDKQIDDFLPGFGRPVALDGATAAIGAPNSTGSAALVDLASGQRLQTFNNPDPDFGDFFATALDLADGRLLATAEGQDVGGITSGVAYLFDAGTGALLETFTHPTPAANQGFGRAGVLGGGEALIGVFNGGAFLFDIATGTVRQEFPGLNPGSSSLALSGQVAAIGDITAFSGATSAGAVQVFDRSTGAALLNIPNPTPGAFDFFGRAVAIDGNHILVGAGQVDVNGIQNAGEAYLFDLTTGNLLHTFVDPDPQTNAFFGRSLDIEGNTVAIGAQGANEVHVFDAISGRHLQTLTESTPFGFYGISLDLQGQNLLVGTGDGGAYLYRTGSNLPPTAVAGSDLAVRLGQLATLDGSGSFDDNTPSELLGYEWRFVSLPAGSGAVLADANTATPSFVADVAGSYLVELVVTDERGLASAPDTVLVSSDNLAPGADAGPDQLAIVGDIVFLDGTGSSDPENDPLGFSWSLTASPPGSSAMLNGADTATPDLLVDLEGVFEATLVVSDDLGPGIPDSVVITVVSAEEFAETEIVAASDTLVALDPGQVTTTGNQNAFSNFLTQAAVAIQQDNIAKAIDKLTKAISRTDGCALRGLPDANGPGRDWVTDCVSQAMIYDSLSLALEALNP